MGVTVTLLFMEQEPEKLVVFTSPAGTVVSRDPLPIAITVYPDTQSGGVDGVMVKLYDIMSSPRTTTRFGDEGGPEKDKISQSYSQNSSLCPRLSF
jgi:hypothetical protein